MAGLWILLATEVVPSRRGVVFREVLHPIKLEFGNVDF